MRRLTRLETGFIAAAVDRARRHAKKHCPDTLRPGYDGETLLLGSAMLDQTQALVHLARYDGHLSRRFFRAVKQLADLRRDERKADEARSSAGSYTPTDPYRGPYVPAQAPPPIDTPNPTAGRIGFRASGDSAPPAGLSKRGGNSRLPQGAGPPAAGSVKRVGKSVVAHASRRAVSPFVATSSSRKHPSTDPSRRGLNPHQPKMTKQTQFLRTPVESMPSSQLFSPGGEAKRVKCPSVQGARRSAPRFLNHARVLEPYVEHGDQAQRRNGGLIACFDRQLVRNAG